jgi:hypothetical protein
MQKVLLIYCEQENPYEFAKLIKYYQTLPRNKPSKPAVLYKNIKEEIIFPLLAKSNMMSVFQTLLKYVDEFEFSNSSNDFTNEEDEYIFKNLIENKFENLEFNIGMNDSEGKQQLVKEKFYCIVATKARPLDIK